MIGTVIALVAAGIGMIPSGKAAHADEPRVGEHEDAVAAAVAGGEAGEASGR